MNYRVATPPSITTDNITFRVVGDARRIASRLANNLIPATTAESFFPKSPRLQGDVQFPSAALFRGRGATELYGRFQGTFHQDGTDAVLEGRFIRTKSAFPRHSSAQLVAGGIAAVVLALAIRGVESFVLAIIGLGLAVVGLWIPRFRARNVETELALLREEVERALRDAAV